MKTIFVSLVTLILSFSAKSQTQKPDKLKAKQLSYLVSGSDTANYWYYRTKTYLLREPSNGYEWRMTLPFNMKEINKIIPNETFVVKLESTQLDSSKKQDGFFLLLD
jgi:hypothetical protein